MKHLITLLVIVVSYGLLSCEKSTTGRSSAPESQSSKDADHARLALKQLKKIDSVTSAGTNYPDYSKRVMDAKVEVDSELADVSSTNQVKSVLADAMDAYIVARDFLGKCLRDGDKYGLTFFDSEEQKRYKRYGLEFYENHAVKDRVAMIWEYASKKIAEAELMLHR